MHVSMVPCMEGQPFLTQACSLLGLPKPNPHTVTHAWYTHPPTLTAVEVSDSEPSTFILMPRSELVDSTPPVPQLPLAW